MTHVHIHDAVVGDIEPTKLELDLIQDRSMQRLRHVRQLGFAYLVYPGANHTRFEHSIGTMQITREIARNTESKHAEELECVGLLHDIGHCAFSHYSDLPLKKYLKTTHEKIGEEIISKTAVKDIIQDSSVSYKWVLSYFRGIERGEVVTGALGSDRLDYLSRDAHYTGAAYGIIDYPNLRNKIVLYKGKPSIYDSAVPSAEHVLIARYTMFSYVYYHHATLIAQGMYERAIDEAIASGIMEPAELRHFNDWQMLARLNGIRESEGLIKRLLSRNLFKRAYYEWVEDAPNEGELGSAIEKAGLKRSEYSIRLIKLKGGDDDIDIVNGDGDFVGKLANYSQLVRTLMDVLKNKERLLVSCDKRNVPKVRAAVEKILP